MENDGLTFGLDLKSTAKDAFIKAFSSRILNPRGLNYKIQFTGPTGTNAVEAAIKLARKITGRTNIVAFTNAFHGCSLGALCLTANSHNRGSSAPMLNGVHRAFYDGYRGANIDTADVLRKQICDPSGGVDKPAAFIIEVIQGDGGLNIASRDWLRKIAGLAREQEALLIVDEIQAGCGRSGRFFSFENYDVVPDIITMAKSISGYGLPMSMVLIRPDLDVWSPGEHNGTFRGNNHAFVTAAASLEHYLSNEVFEIEVRRKAEILKDMLDNFCAATPFSSKGRGFMQGIDVIDGHFASMVKAEAYNQKIIIELCGSYDQVLKILPPLTISESELICETRNLFKIITKLAASVSVWKPAPLVTDRKTSVQGFSIV